MTVVAATGASQRTRAVWPDHQWSRPCPPPNQAPTCARRRSPTCCTSHPRRSLAGRRRASCPSSRHAAATAAIRRRRAASWWPRSARSPRASANLGGTGRPAGKDAPAGRERRLYASAAVSTVRAPQRGRLALRRCAPSGAGLRPATFHRPAGSAQPSATPGPPRPVRSSLALLGPVLPSRSGRPAGGLSGSGDPALQGTGPAGHRGPLAAKEAAMVAISASVNGYEDQAHVFCGACFFGEDVPADKAVQVATEHEASPAHIEAELAEMLIEVLAEALRAERGY